MTTATLLRDIIEAELERAGGVLDRHELAIAIESAILADTLEAIRAPMHPTAQLVGGRIPEHVPGAYPTLSCCGGALELVPADMPTRRQLETLLLESGAGPIETESELRLAYGDR